MTEAAEVSVEGRRLKLSNLEKVLYPEVGFTKAQVIDYYTRIAPFLLPHLKDRPLTLKRYPNGVDGQFFYEKECPDHRPKWVKTVAVWTQSRGRDVNYCLAQDLPTLVWAANLADLELHTSLSKARDITRPTMMVFDLDPGPPAGIVECGEVAFSLREMFGRLDLDLFVKTSGSKGMQAYVPLNTPTDYEKTGTFAHEVATLMEKREPKRIVSKMKKELRGGKVFVDWSQNAQFKTTVCVYSLRARSQPTVSTPVDWDEVESVVDSGDPSKLTFTSDEAIARAEKLGDLFEPVLKKKQRLPKIEKLRSLFDESDS
jgi:bifunctional non-homologous end joining protein LigD